MALVLDVGVVVVSFLLFLVAFSGVLLRLRDLFDAERVGGMLKVDI